MNRETYWAFNIPLQVQGGKHNQVVLNYMPRKERCEWLDLSDVIGEETKKEYFEKASVQLRKLADQFLEASKSEEEVFIYYPEKIKTTKSP